ncbi:alpha/beta fold hydrolase [Cytophagales bacterium LB-30]|uniref:Alpha/beta fold hydrolase n=1 Tax=Shiella aurantiaca TaxID=3058365 RepID=A0ABT8F1Y5_9BACT|nr:alpha/beta fold hydrolase [Shiella aurantiaca]MDN4164457.1 alpha/beta fold hydrolase [Shiella aurantiaca]
MKHLFTFFLLCATSTSVWAQESPVYLETATATLQGTLLLPTEEKPPLVILHSGSGPTDRDGNNPQMKNNSLKLLAEGLQQNGIAVLRYDKRGIGASKGSDKEEDIRLSDFIHDLEGWVNQMQKTGLFSRIILLGHSEGALISLMAAQTSNVQGYISLAGPGRNAADIIYEQIQAQSAELAAASKNDLDSLRQGFTVSQYSPYLMGLFRPSVQPYIISWFALNPEEEIKQLTIPVLIVQGTHDIQVPTAEAQRLAQAKPQATLVLLEEMNHVLKKAPSDRMANVQTYNQPELPLHPELVSTVVSFIKK